MEASLLYQSRFILAESPFWHNKRNSFFWVDIENKKLLEYSCDTRQIANIEFPFRIGFVVEDDQDNLIVGLQGGLAAYNLSTGSFTWLKDVEKESPENRCNDGKCDIHGKLWFGTMDRNCSQGAGSFYLLEQDLTLHKKLDNLTIPNGLTWSLDNKLLYHIDSAEKSIKSYWYNKHSGALMYRKTVVSIPDGMGLPDGMAIDEKGMLWVAHYGGAGVYHWNPENGKLIDKIDLPVPNVTSCAFGGEQLDKLVITTASQGMSEEALKEFPLSGSIFMATAGVKGVAANIFKRSKP